MFKLIKTGAIISILLLSNACSINHYVAKDYGDYLAKDKNKISLPTADMSAKYEISKETIDHRYEFRAATVGYANLWIVEFGKILDETLASEETQNAFDGLSKSDGNSISGNLITFNLIDYKYENYKAEITMNITLSRDGKEVISKSYTSKGEGKGGQMWAGGVFAMMDAIHDSTKSAMDNILKQFLNDINPKAQPLV